MRVTYRTADNRAYWTKRWSDIPADLPMENKEAYPLKYAELAVASKQGRILEAGCGAGRILRYYHGRGYDIVGVDFIKGAIEKLKQIDHTLQIEVGDITHLQFSDQSFQAVLAFGLYHNLEHGLINALKETLRVLTPGGKVCASMRADNLQTRFTDWLEERRSGPRGRHFVKKEFHKLNLTRAECSAFFKQAGFTLLTIYPVENMPFLYKFTFFRSKGHKQFNENIARQEGYRLSWLGTRIQRCLMHWFPNQFCNVYVIMAQKPLT